MNSTLIHDVWLQFMGNRPEIADLRFIVRVHLSRCVGECRVFSRGAGEYTRRRHVDLRGSDDLSQSGRGVRQERKYNGEAVRDVRLVVSRSSTNVDLCVDERRSSIINNELPWNLAIRCLWSIDSSARCKNHYGPIDHFG